MNLSLKHVHFELDVLGKQASLHYLRTKEGTEVDFVLCEDGEPVRLIECKHADRKPASALIKFAGQFPQAEAIQLLRELRQEEYSRPVSIVKGADWLAQLSA